MNASTLWLIAVLILLPLAVARSEDYDQRWIKHTLRDERHGARDGRRHNSPPYRPYRPYRSNHRDHEATRVYGIVQRPHIRVERDELSAVVCFAPISAISHEYTSEDTAWRNAQIAFENLARWQYGERFAAVANAANIQRMCNRSSSPQSVAGKIGEAMASAVGNDGFRHRCQIIASPCMAPTVIDTPIKSDKVQP